MRASAAIVPFEFGPVKQVREQAQRGFDGGNFGRFVAEQSFQGFGHGQVGGRRTDVGQSARGDSLLVLDGTGLASVSGGDRRPLLLTHRTRWARDAFGLPQVINAHKSGPSFAVDRALDENLAERGGKLTGRDEHFHIVAGHYKDIGLVQTPQRPVLQVSDAGFHVNPRVDLLSLPAQNSRFVPAGVVERAGLSPTRPCIEPIGIDTHQMPDAQTAELNECTTADGTQTAREDGLPTEPPGSLLLVLEAPQQRWRFGNPLVRRRRSPHLPVNLLAVGG